VRRLTRRQRVAAIVLVALAVGFITLDLTGSSLRSAHGGVRGGLGALYRGTDGMLAPVRRFVEGIPDAGSNEARVRELQQQNAELHKQLADAQVDHKTAAQLQRLHLAAAASGYRVLPARVLATSASEGFDYTVTLDVGSSSGVRDGQSVTDGAGLVGRVLHADTSTSVVLLAIDPGSGVGARDARTGQLGVATGTGEHGFTFRPLNPAAQLRTGDPIATGPAGSTSFVGGLSIGTLRAVRVSADGTTVAAVSPTVSASGLDLVGVILVGGQSGTARTPLSPGNRLAGAR
jgi:rod shape-determining protein MreC